jgi:hypothetical protein
VVCHSFKSLERDAIEIKSERKISLLDNSNVDKMCDMTYDRDFTSLSKSHENPIVILHFLQLSVSLRPL